MSIDASRIAVITLVARAASDCARIDGMSAGWPILHIPKHRPLLPAAASLLMAGAWLVVAMAVVVLISYSGGYATGNRGAYTQGLADGRSKACGDLASVARWDANVERDLVGSKHDTAAGAAKVAAVTGGALRSVCGGPLTGPNFYDPGAAPPAVKLGHAPKTPKR